MGFFMRCLNCIYTGHKSTVMFCSAVLKGIKRMDTLSEETIVKIILPPFGKRIYSKQKESAPVYYQLLLCMLGKNFSRQHLEIFFLGKWI